MSTNFDPDNFLKSLDKYIDLKVRAADPSSFDETIHEQIHEARKILSNELENINAAISHAGRNSWLHDKF